VIGIAQRTGDVGDRREVGKIVDFQQHRGSTDDRRTKRRSSDTGQSGEGATSSVREVGPPGA